MTEAKLSRSTLYGANLIKAILTRADLKKADLRHAELMEALLTEADLKFADLSKADCRMARFYKTNLHRAKFREANLGQGVVGLGSTWLHGSNLTKADFRDANLHKADLSRADLSRANLSGANLSEANLGDANLSGANLSRSSLERATIVQTELTGAIIKDCRIYGISAWDPIGNPASESGGLIVTPTGQPDVAVDDIEVAQFVYLLLNNNKIRSVLDTIGKKGVLILGRFTPERKVVLDGLRERLRELNYVPMMFDFEGAKSKDFTETVKILAGLSRFIIADITNPKSSPLELQAVVPDYMVPFVPIIQEDEDPFSMFANLQNKYDWVLDVLEYKDAKQLLAVVDSAIIQPALAKEDDLIPRKTEEIRKRRAESFIGPESY